MLLDIPVFNFLLALITLLKLRLYLSEFQVLDDPFRKLATDQPLSGMFCREVLRFVVVCRK